MLSKDFYNAAPEEERAAVDALVSAMVRIEPFGYFVGLITPEDAMSQAPQMSLGQARAFIRAHGDEFEEYLMEGEFVRDLLSDMLHDDGH